MGTFQSIPKTVDARQFEGGLDNGTNLALWVNSNGQLTETRAEWHAELKGHSHTIPERVYIRTYCWRENVFVGDWIVLKQDGTFEHMRPEEFASEYVQV